MLAEAAMLAVLSVERGPGAEACMDEAKLARGVERRLKRRVFVSADQADLRFRVAFEARGDQIEARIELSNRDGTPRGTRSLVTTGHCSKLDDSLALSVALLVDEPPEPEPPPPHAASPAPAAAPAPPPPRVLEIPADVAAPREPWHLGVIAAAKGAWGLLPGVRPGAMLGVRVLPPKLPSLLLQGEAFWPATAERDAQSGARFRLVRGGLAVCPELSAGTRASVGICVGQQVGWISADGYGFDHDAKQGRLTYAFVAGGEARLRLFTPVSIRGAVAAELPVVRDRFASAGRNAKELFRPAFVAISGEVGLEATLF